MCSVHGSDWLIKHGQGEEARLPASGNASVNNQISPPLSPKFDLQASEERPTFKFPLLQPKPARCCCCLVTQLLSLVLLTGYIHIAPLSHFCSKEYFCYQVKMREIISLNGMFFLPRPEAPFFSRRGARLWPHRIGWGHLDIGAYHPFGRLLC